ncbi:hypothetical protein [Vibrio sp. Y29_XK_CS5]|uniref:hypothetical protein n=1 Tax=Vibrio sp. Y29_XK_CS5 TaxID=2957762 RepID=UPI0020A30444|nr:hypothetical protein [Vibrio sp. Y29_XK_CS5]
MSQPDSVLLEDTNTADDWGDFGAVIQQLEQQEQADSETVNVTEPNATNQDTTETNSEAVAGLLEVAFTLTEQATAVISGVEFEFEFDAKSKQAVIDAAIPVFEKHGSTLMAVFGDYIEEATLVLAILGLVYASRKQLEALQRSKMEAEHGEKTSTSGTA